jgi:hypothetical protein
MQTKSLAKKDQVLSQIAIIAADVELPGQALQIAQAIGSERLRTEVLSTTNF